MKKLFAVTALVALVFFLPPSPLPAPMPGKAGIQFTLSDTWQPADSISEPCSCPEGRHDRLFGEVDGEEGSTEPLPCGRDR